MNSKPVLNRLAKRRLIITAAIFVAAVGFIVYGVYSGEASEVYQKAVHICLECIGVG